MLKILIILSILYIQFSIAKKNCNPSTLEKATTKVSSLLRNVKDFFQDIIDILADLMLGMNKSKKNKTNEDWGDDIMKYAQNTLKSGYKVVQNMIPVLDMARSTIDDLTPILPNVTTSKFIESLLNQLVPDLMKNQSVIIKV